MCGFTPYKIPEQYSGTIFGGGTTAFTELKVAAHADFQFGSSTPFTVEFWFAPTQNAGNSKIEMFIWWENLRRMFHMIF